MSWSVVEPAVGILVSSSHLIYVLRFLFHKPGENSYGSGALQSTLRSRDHIQLHNGMSNVKNGESQKERHSDDGSEEYLVVSNAELTNPGQISKTTELTVSYSTR
jgi:hypothetical protein